MLLLLLWFASLPPHHSFLLSSKDSTLQVSAAAAAKSLQSCLTVCDPVDGSPSGSPIPGINSPGKNTGAGCHFLLQCVKVKSESEVAQSCPTLSGPVDCSLPGSSVHGIIQARVLVPLPSPLQVSVDRNSSQKSSVPPQVVYIALLVLSACCLSSFHRLL